MAHTGAALVAKRLQPGPPLRWYLAASWAFDLTAVGHWLPIGVPLTGVAYAVTRKRWGHAAGITAAACVASHGILDLIVGWQLLPGGSFIGARLSTTSRLEVALEAALAATGWFAHQSGLQRDQRYKPAELVPLAAMIVFTLLRGTRSTSTGDDSSLADLAIAGAGLAVTWATLELAERRRSSR